MQSIFGFGLKKSFMAAPIKRPALGQDGGFITDYGDGSETTTEVPGMYTSYDEGPAAEPIPGMYTSYDEGPAAQPVPGLLTQHDLREWLTSPTPDMDWAKLATTLLKTSGESYVAYQKAQGAFDAARAKAGLAPMPLKTAAEDSLINPNTIFLVGGLAAVGLLVALLR